MENKGATITFNGRSGRTWPELGQFATTFQRQDSGRLGQGSGTIPVLTAWTAQQVLDRIGEGFSWKDAWPGF